MRTLLFLLPALTLGCAPHDSATTIDADGDGYDNTVDCDDADAATHPGATEVPYDGINEDCGDVADEYDADADGFDQDVDCDDADAAIHPGATEACDSVDNDCDGQTDEDGASVAYADADADSYGDRGSPIGYCDTVPSGYVTDDTDCDDTNADIHPGGADACGDGIDGDCSGFDGSYGEGETFYADLDGDSYGDPESAQQACAEPPGYAQNADDCDDTTDDVHPGVVETCNGLDDDCDGKVDEYLLVDVYADSDGDGYGAGAVVSQECSPTTGGGFSTVTGDCDDGDATRHPGANDACDGVDNDCSGVADDLWNCASDTGYLTEGWVGDGHVSGGAWASGSFGLELYGLLAGADVCRVTANWVDTGVSASSCAGCTWQFNLTMESTTAVGDYCADFDLADGHMDDWTYDWGFGTDYVYYGYTLEKALLFGVDGTWYLFAYNSSELGGYAITGDADDFSFDRPAGYGYYYTYARH